MKLPNPFYKTCNCCSHKTYRLRLRNCPRCKVPAIWTHTQMTDAEVEEMKARQERQNELAEAMLAEIRLQS